MNFIHWKESLGCCNSQGFMEPRKKNMFWKSLNKIMAQKVIISFIWKHSGFYCQKTSQNMNYYPALDIYTQN